MIARKWSGVTGAVEDLATELDRFSITFPEGATIQESDIVTLFYVANLLFKLKY